MNELTLIIDKLALIPLEGEGGMYCRNYEGAADESGHAAYSSIYYLLTKNSFSHMHRLKTDEIYHFYLGDSIEILLLYPDGHTEVKILGTRLSEGQLPQILVPAGVWQGPGLWTEGSFLWPEPRWHRLIRMGIMSMETAQHYAKDIRRQKRK
ncbi:cupin domain-containing protein [Hungatella sp.]|uniref:cupin domain-containing protein n=1 Tax=Hungatella sp. TaxID=2613924 RepID=UPI002A827AA3|nr:cupin domain-containing protein [Hungatella sp.]